MALPQILSDNVRSLAPALFHCQRRRARLAGRYAMKLVVPDLISNSYFPVIAAADLGFFAREGLELDVELLFPVSEAYQALKAGTVDFVGGSAHSALAAFPRFEGVRLLAAQA